MKVIWDGHDAKAWDQDHGRLAGALQQDWAYGETMMALGVACLRARVERDGQALAMAQFIARRVGLIATVALCAHGPLWLQPLSAREKAQVLVALKRQLPLWRPRLALFSPDETEATSGLRWPGMTRVVTGESTVMINLEHSDAQLRAAMDPRWRNRLVAAEGAGLQVQRVGANPAQYAWLMEEELKQRLARGFSGLPLGWIHQYIHARKHVSKSALILRADAAGERAAAMLFLIHGQAAIYQVGWSSDAGRDLNAHNLILWQAIQELRQRGVRRLDLGGVNTQRSAGLARFKMGSGGEVITLCGTYM